MDTKNNEKYINEYKNLMEGYARHLFDSNSNDTELIHYAKQVHIDWCMRPNHNISINFLDGRLNIRYSVNGFTVGGTHIDNPFHIQIWKEILDFVFEEVDARKAQSAKMKQSKKVVEEVSVDALKNTINNLRDRNGELLGMVSKKSNEIKDANNEIAILKKMLMEAKCEIENLKKVNDDLVIYKELVEDYEKVA